MTKGVRLRDVAEGDLATFFEQQLDPDANRMAAFPARDREAFTAHWTRILGDPTVTIKTILFDGQVAGNIVSWQQSGEREVGYWIGKEYWGKGIATQALSEFLGCIKVRPLHAHVAKHNRASIRVLEKSGFTVCGEDKVPSSGSDEPVEELIMKLGASEIDTNADRQGLQWQVGVWDRISRLYLREVDPRFATVVENVVRRGGLKPGCRVLDLGTGTGSVAIAAAGLVGPAGKVTGVDISPDMLALARRRVVESGYISIDLREGSAEQLPAGDGSIDVLLASLSLMYVIDRTAAAREIRRVLRPGGCFVAAVWAAAERCDIVLFQQTAGKFAPSPPVPGVGPGALADPTGFLAQLADAGIDVRVETEELGFEFQDFDAAWEVLAGVTTAQLPPERQQEAKEAVQAVMWPHGRGPRRFRNVTQFLVGRVAGQAATNVTPARDSKRTR